MNWKNTITRYGSLSIGLQWLMLLLFIAVYGSIELRELFEKGSDPREALKPWHFMLGMLVFVLVWLRIAARFTGPTPLIHPAYWFPEPWRTSAPLRSLPGPSG